MTRSQNIGVRLLTTAWITLLAGGLWVFALTPPARSYEVSLWDAFPLAGWILVWASTAASASLLLMLSTRPRPSLWAISGLAGVIINNGLLLVLPALRGYAVLDRADAVNHIGYVRDILATGSSSALDFYPAMHFAELWLEEVAGFSPGNALIAINVAFAAVWTLSIALCAQEVADDPRAGYVAGALSAVPALVLYHPLVLPSTLSTFLLPLLIGLHLARGRIGSRQAVVLAEVMLALLLVFFHPMSAVYLVIVLAGFGLAKRRQDGRGSGVSAETTAGILPIVLAAFAAWYASFAVVTENAVAIIRWLLGFGDRPSALAEAFRLVEWANLAPANLARVLFNLVGVPAVIAAVSVAVSVLVLISGIRRPLAVSSNLFSYAAAVAAAALAAVPMFLVSSSERHPIRLLRVVVILGICLIAVGLWRRIQSTDYRRWLGFAWVLLPAAILIGQSNLYPHPRNGQPNAPVLTTDIAAVEWLNEHRNPAARQAAALPEYGSRLEAMLLGYEGKRESREWWWEDDLWIPSHFYESGSSCAAAIAPLDSAYLLVPESANLSVQRFPPAVRHLAHQYTETDVARLGNDPSANEIYDNGAVQIWITNPRAC